MVLAGVITILHFARGLFRKTLLAFWERRDICHITYYNSYLFKIIKMSDDNDSGKLYNYI
jgi:hypothetical protein